jgi:hypothetical protein
MVATLSAPRPPRASPPPDVSDAARERVLDLAAACFSARVVQVAAELGLADALADGPLDARAVALRTGTHADAIERVLRALAALGLAVHRDDGRFALTEDGHALRSDVAATARPGVRLFSLWWDTWSALEHSLRTGEPAADVVLGKPAFDHIGEDPGRLTTFQEGMRGLNARLLPHLADAIGDRGAASIVDVAGGHGSLLAAVLHRSPRATGIVLDRPEVVVAGRDFLAAQGLADRARFVAADMFCAVPAGADVYLLKWILHDWDDLTCLRLLRVLRSALRPGAELLVIERILPERVTPGPDALRAELSDLRMLAALGGRERTLAAFDALFEEAGLERIAHTPTGTPLAVLTVRSREGR